MLPGNDQIQSGETRQGRETNFRAKLLPNPLKFAGGVIGPPD
jgi:hypothetical protein